MNSLEKKVLMRYFSLKVTKFFPFLIMNRLLRRLHRWGAIMSLVPLFIVIVTGLLLQVKKEVSWVQPSSLRGSGKDLSVEWSEILASVQAIEEAQVNTWSDIRRLDIRPGRGMIKVICHNDWEVQLDSIDATILSSTYRRSDWIEALHDGSWFGDWAKLYLFLPNGLILLGLWFTGVYLWWLPIAARRKKKLRQAPPA